MELNLTEQQQSLADAVRDFRLKALPSERTYADTAQEFQRQNWTDLVALGVATLELDEALGGSTLQLAETHVAIDELARSLLAGHILELAWRPLAILRRLPSSPAVNDAITCLVKQAQRWAVAKAPTAFVPTFIATPQHDQGWQLDGKSHNIPGIDVCDEVLLWAQHSETQEHLLFRASPAVLGTIERTAALDNDTLGHIDVHSLPLRAHQLIARGPAITDAILRADEAYRALLTVEIASIIDELLDMCLEFVKVRKQFGRPLADFQVLQHQLADFYREVQRTTSMARFAVVSVDELTPIEASLHVSAAAQVAGTNARLLGETAVQMHGAMGFTDECRVAHMVRRALTATARLGSPSWHLDRYHQLASTNTLQEQTT